MSLWMRARDLAITWGDDTRYWQWVSDQRGEEVAELRDVCWLDISATVNLKKLLLKTSYSAYLVFKIRKESYGLTDAKVHVKYVSGEKNGESQSCSVFVDRKKIPGERGRFPQARGKEWMEMKLGEFFNNLGEGEVNAGFSSTDNYWKSGLVVRGIEVRPNYYYKGMITL